MSSLILDASLATGWAVADEGTAEAETLLERVKVEGAGVPDLFWHEMRNVLLKIERRGRSQHGDAELAVLALRRLPITVLDNRSDALNLHLARRYQLTAYDASYLDLSIALELPLATADRRLAEAAHRTGVAVLGSFADAAP